MFFARSGAALEYRETNILGNLYTPLVSFSYILAYVMDLVYRCFLVICAPHLACFFARSGATMEYCKTDDTEKCALVGMSYILASLMELVYRCF